LCVGKKNNHTNLQNLTHYQRQYSTKGENVTVCQSSFTEIIRNRLTDLGGHVVPIPAPAPMWVKMWNRWMATVNVRSMCRWSISDTHTHTHQLMPSADTSASCLYSNLHSVTVGHRRGLRAFRKSPAPRGYAMRMQRCISVRRSRTDESEEKQAAAVLAAKCRIAAATYRTRLRIGTACGIFSIFYWGTRDIPPKKPKLPLP